MIDDVLSDSLLHKQVQPGEIAFMELSRRSGQPVCTGEHCKGSSAHTFAFGAAPTRPLPERFRLACRVTACMLFSSMVV